MGTKLLSFNAIAANQINRITKCFKFDILPSLEGMGFPTEIGRIAPSLRWVPASLRSPMTDRSTGY